MGVSTEIVRGDLERLRAEVETVHNQLLDLQDPATGLERIRANVETVHNQLLALQDPATGIEAITSAKIDASFDGITGNLTSMVELLGSSQYDISQLLETLPENLRTDIIAITATLSVIHRLLLKLCA